MDDRHDSDEKSNHNTGFHAVNGPVHTGSGNIIIKNDRPYSSTRLLKLIIFIFTLIAIGVLIWLLAVALSQAAGPMKVDGPAAAKSNLRFHEQTLVTVQARGEGLTYVWTADNGIVEPAGYTAQSTITYTAPGFSGNGTIRVQVQDKNGHAVSSQTVISIVQEPGGNGIQEGIMVGTKSQPFSSWLPRLVRFSLGCVDIST